MGAREPNSGLMIAKQAFYLFKHLPTPLGSIFAFIFSPVLQSALRLKKEIYLLTSTTNITKSLGANTYDKIIS